MIFDFHTHIFPDKIAEKTIKILKQNIIDIQGWTPPSFTDATLSGLKKSMSDSGIDFSLVLPIATTPRQSATINAFAAQINGHDNIFSFGSVHPFEDTPEETLEKVKEYNLKGIKLHPQYQDVYMDSPEMLKVLKKCEELGLMVLVHSGVDVGKEPPVKCTPKMIYDVMQKVPSLTLIAAHMGGWDMWDDVRKYLIGTSVYFDTAYAHEFMGEELFHEFLTLHDKTVFGTDSPWDCQKTAVAEIAALGLETELYENIMFKNAFKLMEIDL